MTPPIKSVAIAGATGLIGKPILEALMASGKFESIRVLTRQGSSHVFPEGVRVEHVDYGSVSSIEGALRGVDGLVSALSFDSIETQRNLVDGAFAAGVRRMIPSEYGNDTENPKLATVPIYLPKIAIREHLDRKVAEGGGAFSYTVVMNASFLHPGYALNFLVDMDKKKALIKDGGDVLFCAATLAHIGQAIVGIFTHPDETANRSVKIRSVETTQNEILSMAQKIDPAAVWDLSYCRTEEEEAKAHERWAKGDRSEEVVEMFINRAFLGEGWGGYFPVVDNELLGIGEIGKQGLEDIIRTAVTKV
ncbi:hypothetical protein RB595_001157 [Gaeumannomyces hyphopodioides]